MRRRHEDRPQLWLARWGPFGHVEEGTDGCRVKRAIQKPHFALVEVLSPCPTQFGRRGQMASPAEMIERLREIGDCLEPRETLEGHKGGFEVGLKV